MRIEIKVSKEELEEAEMNEDQVYEYVIDNLDDLPGFNVYIEITEGVEI